MGSRNILLQVFHPHWFESRANKRLAAAARRVPSLSFQQMETQYGDYLERADVERERVRIQNADILVMQFPIWSMTFPATVKTYLDTVWFSDFGAPKKVLPGKRLMLAVTTELGSVDYSASGRIGHTQLKNCFCHSRFLRGWQESRCWGLTLFTAP
ncbi:nADP(H) oxidoreductase [Sutterella sp. CAG:351]|uniref:NAD(P)H-dependent oxidoreductase n=1 Tax=Dakarella massiliensis TaxID=1506471 RepID=UPI0003356FBA|nr:NAD(P)H-dependent oxidoreductase [Dakarella massiliensis]CDE50140.1 nADP(H) oxidoreductase [Sutterella sp. CAG:351]